MPLLLEDAEHSYIYGPANVPLAQVARDDASTDYLHADVVGSVRATTNATGRVTSDADYDPYGRPRPVGTGTASKEVTRFGFAGEYTDPSRYLYLRARYYDPATAQFLTRDPLEHTTGDAYGYSSADPLLQTNPTGLICFFGGRSDGRCRGSGAVDAVVLSRPADAVASGLNTRVGEGWHRGTCRHRRRGHVR